MILFRLAMLATLSISLWSCSGPLQTETPAPRAPAEAKGPNAKLDPRDGPLSVGSKVPAFQLVDQNGTPVSAAELTSGKGSLVIICPGDTAPGSRPAYVWARTNATLLKSRGVELLLIAPGDPATNSIIATREEIRAAILSDPKSWVSRAFGAVPEGSPGAIKAHGFLLGSDARVQLVSVGLPDAAEAMLAAETLPGKKEKSVLAPF